MKKSPEMLNVICDFIASNGGKNAAARNAELDKATMYRWIASSKENPDAWQHCWPTDEDEPLPFHKNCARAQSIGVARLRLKALEIAEYGQRTEIFFQGERKFEINPEWVKEGGEDDPALCKLLGIAKYLTDEKGKLIPATINSAVNAQVLIAALRSLDPAFADKSEVTMKHQGGVLVVGAMQTPQTARAIVDVTPPKQVENMSEIVVDDPEAAGSEADSQADAEAIRRADLADAEERQRQQAQEAKQARTEALPPQSAPPIPAGNSLRADLEARAAALALRAPATAQGKYLTMAERRALGMTQGIPKVDPYREPDENVGRGTVKSGGVKVL